jgi:hypothetical protein
MLDGEIDANEEENAFLLKRVYAPGKHNERSDYDAGK